MTDEWKNALLSFIGGGGMVAALRIIPVLINLYKTKDSAKALKDIKWIYERLNEIKKIAHADIVWIGKSSNGGGIPRVGHNIFHSVCYIVGAVENVNGLQNRIVDSSLAVLLTRIIASKVTISMASLQHGDFGDTLNDWGVKKIVVFHVKLTKRSFYYLGCGFKEYQNNPVCPGKQTKIIQVCQEIAPRFRKS